MTAVAGLRSTADFGTGERPENFRQFIAWRTPDGDAPFTALMAGIKADSTDEPEFNWWDEGETIVRLQTNGVNNTTTNATIIVNSADPDATNPQIPWGLATHLKPGDLLLVEPAADTTAFTQEILRVTGVTNTTTFTVTRGAAGTTAAAIPDDSFLTLIGSSYEEGSRAPLATSRNPTKFRNVTQIFKDTYKVSKSTSQSKIRTGDPLANDRRRKRHDHMRGLETAFLWGRPSETTGTDGEPQRTTGGLRYFTPASTTTIFTTTPTWNTFVEAVAPVFDFSSEAGDTRVLLVGTAALIALNKLIKNDASTSLEMGDVITIAGMRLRELVTPVGRLMLKRHPMLSRHSLWSNSMFIVDFSSIKYRPLGNRDTKFFDNVQENDEDATKGYWLTEVGLEVRNGGLSNGYIGNFVL